ncbi:MAG TPA: family 20 glycosylhydrolase [Thermomonas sp.]|nr:family 20 glycosylhydrolase [Thermomonas sp.]
MPQRTATLLPASLLALCLALATAVPASAAETPVALPSLVPRAASVHALPGRLVLANDAHFIARGAEAGQVLAQFARLAGDALPEAALRSAGPGALIELKIAPDSGIAPEGYRLQIGGDGGSLQAADAHGLFNGAMTLLQLLQRDADGTAWLPAVRIDDAPRFAWRGLMLDSARHFQSVEEIKRLLDAMAQLKLDSFHWHLTDDQGWRFPVPGWPKLTEVGHCRIPSGDGGIDAATGKPVPYCGFYTEAQVRDVVAHAAALHIDVVPEVDIPGHATAAISAYPQLGVSGQPIAVSNEWGVNVNLFNADEATMRFLEDVMGQLVKLFPGRYVHIGGDEAVKDQWKDSAKMQARIRELGVKDEAGLQAWMVARLERYLATHDRRLLGWDEILDGDLPESATVMSWRGTDGGIAAAKRGHDVVMAPWDKLYLDYLQTTSPNEEPGRPTQVSLETVYAFEPVPAALDAAQAKHIIGVQANVWTEHMRSFARVQHAVFPRIAAVAESGWSPREGKDYADFLRRLPAMLPRWNASGITPAPTPFQPLIDAKAEAGGKARIEMSQPLGYAIRYTTDGSAPKASSPAYTAPLSLPLPASLQAQAFAGEQALAAPVRRELTAASLLTRSDEELAMCTGQLMLRLEDDGPREGARAIFNVDIFNPCWSWKQAPLAGAGTVEVRAGRIPYFFQLAHDESHRTFKPAKTAHGELELHAGCDGPLLATLPMPGKTDADGFVTLRTPLRAAPAGADLCLWFTGDTRPAMWVLDRVTLVPSTASP